MPTSNQLSVHPLLQLLNDHLLLPVEAMEQLFWDTYDDGKYRTTIVVPIFEHKNKYEWVSV